MQNKSSYFTPQQALQKIKQFCSYQERCHSEVKDKLYSYGLNTSDVENITATIIQENYLNEERFAKLYAGGKFRIKQWGKIKIKYELKYKQISAYNIKKALLEIEDDAYLNTLQQQAKKYFTNQTKGLLILRHLKTKKYLMQKGFETDLINDVIKNFK